MIRVVLLFAAGLASLSGVARAEGTEGSDGEKPATRVVSLREAAAAGSVTVKGVSPQSYRQVTLKLVNRTETAIDVDLAGSWVRPVEAGSSQRLGLGPPVDESDRRPGRGTILVRLEGRGSRSVDVQTVCLDSWLPAPTSTLPRGPLAAVRRPRRWSVWSPAVTRRRPG